MSYHIYTTKGIVLSHFPIKESDRVYSILTRELGLVRARAISVRKGVSKLRGNVEPLSLSQVSFVRGKNEWRLTFAELIRVIPRGEEVLKPLALLEKLVQGEVPHPELFDMVEEFLLEERKEGFETRFVAHIMHHLGYLKSEDLELKEKELIKAINEGLKNSHLT